VEFCRAGWRLRAEVLDKAEKRATHERIADMVTKHMNQRQETIEAALRVPL
jgi:hypothetical protein